MAKRSLGNIIVGEKSFKKGEIYPDSAITEEIDSTNFEDVSDDALIENQEIAGSEEEAEETPKKKRSKKVAGEELE